MKKVFQETIFLLAEKGKKIGINREKLKACLFPIYRWFCWVEYKLFNHVYLYHVEIPVTQRCTLKCKDCSFMMPYFENPKDYYIDDLLAYMDRLYECVDTIQIFRILGGEPFVYKDLDQIIKKAVDCPKVKMVDVVTNGTLLPSERVRNVMKDPKVTIQISDYGNISYKKNELKRICEENGIKCVIRSMSDKNWFTAGDLHFRGKVAKDIEKQLKKCAGICRSFQNGKLYFCPRASFGALLGIPDSEKDYVDFTVEGNWNELRRQIFELNQRKGFLACNYCDEGTDCYRPIPPAQQISDSSQIEEWRANIGKQEQ
ncbi:MAG: radical SAM protein [Butyrivibrio sp.]|nr:radical SAM protein [Butyrivibrio sp.]